MRLLFTLIIFFGLTGLNAQNNGFVKGELLLQSHSNTEFKQDLIKYAVDNGLIIQGLDLIGPAFNIYKISFRDKTIDLNYAMQTLYNYPGITTIQKNHYVNDRETVPDDTHFNEQWHLKNTGEDDGISDADIDAVEAWDITTGGLTTHGDTIVVCIIESGGIDYTHEDLAANMWKNHAEIPDDGIDNDNNGYVDDYLGWDIATETDQIGFSNHGTKVAGVIGAKGNNGLGISGVNWNVKMMTVKGQVSSDEATVIAAFSYPMTMRKIYNKTYGEKGAFVVATNGSWGINNADPASHPLWCSIYDSLGSVGILNVGATTNRDVNVDIVGDMPTRCTSDFMIGATMTNNSDIRFGAGYGPTSIDLAAPGDGIYTTHSFGETLYGDVTGTSFAAPTVTGAIALAYAAPCPDFINLVKHDPAAAALAMREYILGNVDPILTLTDDVVTGGRLNINNTINDILDGCEIDACIIPFDLHSEFVTDTSAVIYWNGFADDYSLTISGGMFDEDEISIIDADSLYINTLEPCTKYTISIKAICDIADESLESHTYSFTTDGCCENPNLTLLKKTQSTIKLGWQSVLYADQYNLRYSEEGLDDWTVLTDVDSALIITDLDSCTTYEFQIYTLCADSTRGYSDSFKMITLGCGACTEAEYCTISNVNSRFEWIDEIRLNDAIRLTGNNLGWYTSDELLTSLLRGENYDFYFSPGYLEFNYTEDVSVWIDFNQDGVFDFEEKVLNVLGITTPFTRTIVVPDDAIIGVTKMRIAMDGERSPAACPDISVLGEYEDYCVYVGDELNLTTEEKNTIKIYPNPVIDQLFVETNLDQYDLRIYAAAGNLVHEEFDSKNEINTSTLSKGVYFIEIKSNNNIYKLKFIKQ